MVEDDSVWDEYVKFSFYMTPSVMVLQMDPSAKGMRHKTWSFFPSWREIFGRDRATGERSSDPFKEANDVRDEEIGETCECNLQGEDCTVPDEGCIPEAAEDGLEGEPDSFFNANVDPTQNSSSAAKRTGGSSSKKRKSNDLSDGLPKLLEMVTNFCETANARLASLTRVLESEFGDPEHRSLIWQQVRELGEIDQREQLMVENRLVKDPKELELFLGLTRDCRVDYVRLILAGKI
ncbi:UNVERIFIED_CONTAM: hypothetical protein Sindi_2497500 [Sesamum indicum]